MNYQTVEGQSFSLYLKFERELFKGKSGIYGLYYRNECIYVGQSSNLYYRLNQHYNVEARLKELEKIKNKADYYHPDKKIEMYNLIKDNLHLIEFKILRFCDYADLDVTENMFISLYQPKYNYVGVDVDYKNTARDKETGKVIRTKKIPIGFQFIPPPKKKEW